MIPWTVPAGFLAPVFIASVGDWTIVGASDKHSEAEEAAHAAALAEFFEEGSSPEEFWDAPESGSSALTNYMSSFPEGEAPWRGVRPSRSSASKANRKQKKPYTRSAVRKR
ncbi:hypothetical protein RhiJN_06287 [Ceratobasidium sp. AG-Ba]|nr:hypothetical protein RhiJN_06287 [Ceratobasidium sp. AG-Ba]